MSEQYDAYLVEHKNNVKRAYEWIRDNIPEVLKDVNPGIDLEHQICFEHDESKNNPDEYSAYDKYFYGRNKSYSVVEEFNYAWLYHQHRNPHHWQYWLLTEDTHGHEAKALEIPKHYVIEMICDWWSFSWKSGNLFEIFDWYNERESNMLLHSDTKTYVRLILNAIQNKMIGAGRK